MAKKLTMTALQKFPFRGVPVKPGEDIEPDNAAQAELLKLIKLAEPKKRSYSTRVARPSRVTVMEPTRTATAESDHGG